MNQNHNNKKQVKLNYGFEEVISQNLEAVDFLGHHTEIAFFVIRVKEETKY